MRRCRFEVYGSRCALPALLADRVGERTVCAVRPSTWTWKSLALGQLA